MEIVIIILLIVVILVFFTLLIIKQRQIKYYEIVSKNLSAMRIIQSMFEIMGASIPSESKIVELNKVILDTYGCKYSSVVVFDGTDYVVKATNIDKTYLDSLKELAQDQDLSSNVIKNVSKYLTTSPDKTLRYKSAIERGIKSCIFSPIYHGDTYLGFWVIEDEIENAFDSISKSELAKIKNNMGVFLESTIYENIVESAENTDKQTGFYNTLYLYSKARKELMAYETNCMIFMSVSNLSEINMNYSRDFGNILFKRLINLIKDFTSSDTICIRYSGAKLLLLVTNSNAEVMHPTIERLLSRIRTEVAEKTKDGEISLRPQIILHTIKKQNSIEKEVEKMANYLESMKETDTIKIV